MIRKLIALAVTAFVAKKVKSLLASQTSSKRGGARAHPIVENTGQKFRRSPEGRIVSL
jgi:hypothetical protein